MRRPFLGIAVATLVVADLALAPALVTAGGAGPDFLLPLVVYLALAAPRGVSPWLYFSLGVFSDLAAVPRPGLRGFTYLAVAMLIENVSPGRWRRHPLLQALFALAGALVVEGAYMLVAARFWPGGPGAAVRVMVTSAFMTSLVALALSWPLSRLGRAFHWPAAPRTMSWAQAAAAAGAGAGTGSAGQAAHRRR